MRNKSFSLKFSFLPFLLLFVFISHSYADRAIKLKLTGGVSSDRRIALIIGNSAYKSSPLKNPVNDAQDIASKLSKLGFEVSLGKNMTRKQMRISVRQFGNDLKQGGVGLFYYAGHGMQVQGKNYLIPIGTDIQSEFEVEDEAVNASLVLRNMELAGNTMNMVFLDACRNNPFARSFRSGSRGLAQMDAPSGSLIVYATAPGSIAADGDGRNGIFTKHLLGNIESGLPVSQMLMKVRVGVRKETSGKQTPWESSSLEGDFYFNAGSKITSTSSITPSSSLDSERQKLEEERRQFEAEKQLMKDRQKLAEERRKLASERERLRKEQDEVKVASLPLYTFTEARRSKDRRYIDNGKGIIQDTKTGLMWTKEDSYADTGNCMDWNASKSYVSRLNTGGYSDWRLPTVKELKGIYEKSKSSNMTYDHDSSKPLHLDSIFADGAAYGFWSSETVGFSRARYVYFNDGNVDDNDRGSCIVRGVRAVRS